MGKRKSAVVSLAAAVILTCYLAQTIDCYRLTKTERRGGRKEADPAKTVVQEGKIVFGRVFKKGSALDSKVTKADASMASEAGHQVDFAGWPKGQSQDLFSREAAWRRMAASLQCGRDQLKFRAVGPGVSQFAVEQGTAPPMLLSQVPSSCGYSMERNYLVLDMLVPYDGCNVVKEGGSYVLPMRWQGVPVSLWCPATATPQTVPTYRPSDPEMPQTTTTKKPEPPQTPPYFPPFYHFPPFPPTTTAASTNTVLIPAWPQLPQYPKHPPFFPPFYPFPTAPPTTTAPPSTTSANPAWPQFPQYPKFPPFFPPYHYFRPPLPTTTPAQTTSANQAMTPQYPSKMTFPPYGTFYHPFSPFPPYPQHPTPNPQTTNSTTTTGHNFPLTPSLLPPHFHPHFDPHLPLRFLHYLPPKV